MSSFTRRPDVLFEFVGQSPNSDPVVGILRQAIRGVGDIPCAGERRENLVPVYATNGQQALENRLRAVLPDYPFHTLRRVPGLFIEPRPLTVSVVEHPWDWENYHAD